MLTTISDTLLFFDMLAGHFTVGTAERDQCSTL